MEEASQIALITAGASIAGGFVGQFLSLLYTGRVNQLERVRMVEARSAQLYLREIEAYDQLVTGYGEPTCVPTFCNRLPQEDLLNTVDCV
jgi:hypothetical protein